MTAFLTDPANLPFTASLAVMVLFVFLEAATLLLGAGFSEMLDSLLPDFDMDIDLPDAPPSGFMQILTWFRVGEVPLLMLLLIALTVFGLTGLGLQHAVQVFSGKLLPPLLAVIPSCFVSLSLVRVLGGVLGKYMPKDESTAVSEQSLIGKTATIIAGKARRGSPVQGKVRDEHQQVHYLLIEPEDAEETFAAGDTVVLLSQQGAVFRAEKTTRS